MNSIPGLFYKEDLSEFISSSFENELKEFIFSKETQEKYYQKVSPHSPQSRNVIHYGYTYPYAHGKSSNKITSGTLEKAADMPPIILSLRDKIKEIVENSILFPHQFINIKDLSRLNQCIINIYEPGQGIAPHVDDIKLFGDTIVSFTFFSSREITLTSGNNVLHLITKPSSIYILTKEARYSYKHEMKKRKKDYGVPRGTVVSITFREYTCSHPPN